MGFCKTVKGRVLQTVHDLFIYRVCKIKTANSALWQNPAFRVELPKMTPLRKVCQPLPLAAYGRLVRRKEKTTRHTIYKMGIWVHPTYIL